MKNNHWIAVIVVVLLILLWTASGLGPPRATSPVMECGAIGDEPYLVHTALSQALGPDDCNRGIIGITSPGVSVLWSAVNEWRAGLRD